MQFPFQGHCCVLDLEVNIIKKRAHVLIIGRVQGVWYRSTTKQKAEQLGIKGWVKNTSDGDVEAVFEGDEELVDEMVKWCYVGSELSKVKDVQINSEKYSGEFKDFKIVY